MKKEIIKLIELIIEKNNLEKNDKVKEEMMENNPDAFREGFTTSNMKRIDKIEQEIEIINL